MDYDINTELKNLGLINDHMTEEEKEKIKQDKIDRCNVHQETIFKTFDKSYLFKKSSLRFLSSLIGCFICAQITKKEPKKLKQNKTT